MSPRNPTIREKKLRVVRKLRKIQRAHAASARLAEARAKEHRAAARKAAHLVRVTKEARELA